MRKFRNTDPQFGDSGPFEVESKESFADEMQESFERWARERETFSPEKFEDAVKEMREEFIKGLEDVTVPIKDAIAEVLGTQGDGHDFFTREECDEMIRKTHLRIDSFIYASEEEALSYFDATDLNPIDLLYKFEAAFRYTEMSRQVGDIDAYLFEHAKAILEATKEEAQEAVDRRVKEIRADWEFENGG